MKSENAHLTKKLKESEKTITVREDKLKKVEQKAKYYEDKCTSIEMFTTIKVRVEMMKEFVEGKTVGLLFHVTVIM